MGRVIAERLSTAAPTAKVIFWTAEAESIELIGADATTSVHVADDALIAEIVGWQAAGGIEPA